MKRFTRGLGRRRFVGSLLAPAALQTFLPRAAAFQAEPTVPDPEVKRVLVMFKCHLDVGFTNTQAGVVSRYFEQYFPQAIQLAEDLRNRGGDRYIWTTGSWLIYQYLEKAGREDRQRMERAIRSGDIAWHALPFSFQTELMDRSLIAGALGFSQSLDRRFQRTTTGAKMTDVPGHTIGIVGPLAEHGLKLLTIGVNSASTPPDVPPAFLWKDPAGNSLVMLYHLHSYGGVIRIPGSDLAVDVEVRGDNRGPHTVEEIQKIYSSLRQRFPNAEVRPSNLTDIANAVAAYREHLPVVTQEIGDTWIYGVPSDPIKIARYREVARLRSEWVRAGKIRDADSTDLALLSSLLLEVEHTWGTDTKRYLDFDHYSPHDLAQMLDQPKYVIVQSSWKEKRQDLYDGIATLPEPLRTEASRRVESLKVAEPKKDGLKPHVPDANFETKHFVIALDPKTGAMCRLHDKKSGRNWATLHRPLALFAYQTLSKSDYDQFFADYLKSKADWAPKDFGKPNVERFGAQSRTWLATLSECSSARTANGHRILAELKIDDDAAEKSGRVAWPKRVYLEYVVADAAPIIEIRLSWFKKSANRMPEALWLSFQPPAADPAGWRMGKCGTMISPLDVVTGGNRSMHAIGSELQYRGPEGTFAIETLDAPVVAVGKRHPVHFSREQPDPAEGFHFSLFNNGWGTNYVQWFGEDVSFRFRIRA